MKVMEYVWSFYVSCWRKTLTGIMLACTAVNSECPCGNARCGVYRAVGAVWDSLPGITEHLYPHYDFILIKESGLGIVTAWVMSPLGYTRTHPGLVSVGSSCQDGGLGEHFWRRLPYTKLFQRNLSLTTGGWYNLGIVMVFCLVMATASTFWGHLYSWCVYLLTRGAS